MNNEWLATLFDNWFSKKEVIGRGPVLRPEFGTRKFNTTARRHGDNGTDPFLGRRYKLSHRRRKIAHESRRKNRDN